MRTQWSSVTVVTVVVLATMVVALAMAVTEGLFVKDLPPAIVLETSIMTGQPPQTQTVDIAKVNLMCAQGLPGAEHLDVDGLLRQLDGWSERVRTETERHLYRFRRNRAEFDGSEAYFRMLMMAVVVHEDFRVRYNPALMATPGVGSGPFFARSEDVFLHGLLREGRLGTCSSMPVLYVALGRRLGYPVFLVPTKGHLFVRWDGRGERLNLEATSRGMNHYDDAHYLQWPFPLSDQEIAENGYLRSMTPAEEAAAFLAIRGACWQENGRWREAREAYAAAAKLAPRCLLYRELAAGSAPMVASSPVATPSTRASARASSMALPGSPGPPDPRLSANLDPNPLRRLNQPNH